MKRGIGYVIALNIVLSILIGGLIKVNTVNAYQDLYSGDQLLYYAGYDYYYDEQYMTLFEYALSSYSSYLDVHHQELQADEYHSYTVKNNYGSYTDGRRTSTYIDIYRNDYDEYYQYNYGGSYWEYMGGYYDDYLSMGSSTYTSSYNIYSGICNSDIPGYFGGTTYLYNEMRGYTINGVYSTYNCSIYYDSYSYSDVYTNSMYNITYDYYTNYYSDSYFYVDQDTGFILEYDTYYSYNDYANFDEYADYEDIDCNVTYDYTYYTSSNYYWFLQETTVNYGSSSDADLPGLDWDWGYDYSIYGGLEYLTIYYNLYDSFSTCTIDVYLNDVYVETLYSVIPGYNSYDLYVKDLPIDPYGNDPVLQFVVSDNSGMGHVTVYNLWIDDVRPDYPVVAGPDYYDYQIGDTKTLYWELQDINYDGDYFELKFNGTLVLTDTWNDGKLIGFNLHDNVFTPGYYEIKIKAVDLMGHETYKLVTINAYENTEPTNPTETNPTDTEPSNTESGSNTVTLDAPTTILVFLSILGVISLTAIIRKRK